MARRCCLRNEWCGTARGGRGRRAPARLAARRRRMQYLVARRSTGRNTRQLAAARYRTWQPPVHRPQHLIARLRRQPHLAARRSTGQVG